MNISRIPLVVSKTGSSLARLMTVILLPCLLLMTQGCTTTATQAGYASPDDAVNSFISSLRTNDTAQIRRVLGPNAGDVLSSGDAVADHNSIEKFLASYDAKHSLATNDDGSMTLVVGDDDWPTPIPIYQDSKTGKWMFDTDAGKDEIISRRVGRNELDVIQVCKAIADAEHDYADNDADHDGIHQYAQRILSDPGKKDGLYWPTAEDEPQSPLGQFVADAIEEGYSPHRTGEPQPYHGYFYHILTSQGPNAPGGARDYIANGKMIGGFAVIARPAEYGKSGVMTFIINQDGIVYQRDLGPETASIAKSITSYDPSPEWKKAE